PDINTNVRKTSAGINFDVQNFRFPNLIEETVFINVLLFSFQGSLIATSRATTFILYHIIKRSVNIFL
ncbi:hypothetical protein, partial [Ureibacillus aquaedulcis]